MSAKIKAVNIIFSKFTGSDEETVAKVLDIYQMLQGKCPSEDLFSVIILSLQKS